MLCIPLLFKAVVKLGRGKGLNDMWYKKCQATFMNLWCVLILKCLVLGFTRLIVVWGRGRGRNKEPQCGESDTYCLSTRIAFSRSSSAFSSVVFFFTALSCLRFSNISAWRCLWYSIWLSAAAMFFMIRSVSCSIHNLYPFDNPYLTWLSILNSNWLQNLYFILSKKMFGLLR